MGAAISIGLWALKHWKLIAGALVAVALVSYIGWLKIDAAWLRGDLAKANGKVVLAQQYQRSAEEDAAQQHEYLTRQIEVNRANAALTEKMQQLVQAEHDKAAKAKERGDILDRSYSTLMGRLNDVDGDAPLSAQQRAFVRELWCLEQAVSSAPSGCPGSL